MTRDEAAEILQVSPHASADDRATQYESLRRQLEDKLAKAPTPGLREKYRTSLKELDDAVAVLAQSDDSAALPVLNKATTPAPESRSASPAASATATREATPKAAPRKAAGNKEFILVAVVAVVVLAGGGWFVVKSRAERAEAEAKAESSRLANEAKRRAEEDEKGRRAAAEKDQQEQWSRQLASLKSRFAELNIACEAVQRAEAVAERELAELKSESRNPAPGANEATLRQLERKITVQSEYLSWLRKILPGHPAIVLRARAASLLESRSIAEATKAVEDYAAAIEQLRSDQVAALDRRDQSFKSSQTAQVQSTDPRILRRGTLQYPPAMLRAELEGVARISCVVQPDGKPTDLKILEATTPEFGQAALRYVATFTFAPGVGADGKPVATTYTVPVQFKLQ